MEIYARASLLEILLIENFEDEYLTGVTERLLDMSKQQSLFYEHCREGIERYARSTAESFFTGIGSGVVKGVGEVLSWLPFVNDTGADKALKSAGDSMDKSIDDRVQRKFTEIDSFKVGATEKYAEDIKELGVMYRSPLTFTFNQEKVYVGIGASTA